MDGLLASPDASGESRIPGVPADSGVPQVSAIPTTSPARNARVQPLAAADLERGFGEEKAEGTRISLLSKSLPESVLLRGCPRFQRQIAPDSLYFGPGDRRAIRFNTTVSGVEYAQDPAECRWFNDEDPGWPGEDMEGS